MEGLSRQRAKQGECAGELSEGVWQEGMGDEADKEDRGWVVKTAP